MSDEKRLKNDVARLVESSKALAGRDFSLSALQSDAGWRQDASKEDAKKRLGKEVDELVRRGKVLGGVNLTGMLKPGNMDLNERPVVHNEDGSISTVRSMSINIDGKEALIPTVAHDGSRILSEKEAIKQFEKTGKHLGIFDTSENATAYAQALHEQQEADYADKPLSDKDYFEQVLNTQQGAGKAL